jgi:hypothetical protein
MGTSVTEQQILEHLKDERAALVWHWVTAQSRKEIFEIEKRIYSLDLEIEEAELNAAHEQKALDHEATIQDTHDENLT